MSHSSRSASLTIAAVVMALSVGACGVTAGGMDETEAAIPADPAIASNQANRESVDAAASALEPSPILLARIAGAETSLRAIEARLDQVMTQRRARGRDAEALEKTMFEYAQQMKAALDGALSDAAEASRSRGRRGNAASLESFEVTARRHKTATERIAKRLDAIAGRIKRGEIKLDPGVPMSPAPPDVTGIESTFDPERSREEDGLSGESADSLVAAACVALCANKNWTGCAVCVAAAGPAAVIAWNAFLKCWNGACACRWYKPWCCAQKAWCLTKFVAQLG